MASGATSSQQLSQPRNSSHQARRVLCTELQIDDNMNFAFQGLVHRVTDRCGDACVCVARKNEEEEVCCLSTCQVKVLKVSGYRGTRRELNQMKHFLGILKCLETVKVGVEVDNHREDKNVNKNYQRITQALTKLPRASSNPFLLIYPLCN